MSQDYVAGQRLGDYEVLEVLGAGGMGKVYKVRNVISDRVEAMKIILPNLANQKELADRFLREIKLLGSLNHPNIAGLRTALTINDQLVMIMEYVEGITLASRLRQGPIPPADAINYTDQILSALSYAHQLNVIHRDIKPANMMLTPQGVVKLMDFGLARPGEQSAAMTVTSTTLGSVNYMPPEQVKGEAVDARSDLYSLGVSLYEMVTGRLPFQAESGYSLMTAHVQETPQAPIAIRPDLPTTLNQIILISLAKDPAKRFQSSEAFRNALKSVPLTSSVAAGAGSPATAWAPVATSQPEIQPALAAAASSSAGSSAATNSYRGFYVALGALLVVAVLFAAGFYLPRRIKTHASAGQAPPVPPASAISKPVAEPPPSTAGAPASETAAAPSATNQPEVVPTAPAPSGVPTTANDAKGALPAATVAPPDLKPATAPVQSKQAVRTAGERLASSRPAPAAASAPAPSASDGQPQPTSQSNAQDMTTAAAAAAQLEQVQQESDQLNSRALAVSQSLDGLRRAQSAQGLGLRGDMVAAEQRMKTNMSAAQSALDKQDAAKAKMYLNMAVLDVEKLEKFLGR